jgi:hypothetical protein
MERAARIHRDHGQPHDHIPDDHDREVEPGQRPGYTRGEDQDAGHLHEYGHPIGDVLVVVGRCEPREVHPRPPDGEEDERVADQHVAHLPIGQALLEAVGGLSDGYDKGEVEEQL